MARANRSSKSPPAFSVDISSFVGSKKSISSSIMIGSSEENEGEKGACADTIVLFLSDRLILPSW